MSTKEVLNKKTKDAQIIYDYLSDVLKIESTLPVTFIVSEKKLR